MFQNIGFIGTGNMGGALARAVDRGAPEGAVLRLSNRTPAKAEALAAQLRRASVSTNREIAEQCDLIFLGVKPQKMAELMAEIRPVLRTRTDRFVVCSMATGITIDSLTRMLGGEYPLIRILPNTPAAIGEGIAQFCVRRVTPEEKEQFLTLMAASGLMQEMEEDRMTVANCISGAGVAFAAMFLEALADGAVACGLPRGDAMIYAAQTMVGTGGLYLQTKEHPGVMKDAVSSPGGTTMQGIRAMESRGFRAAVMEAVIAAYERALQLN